MQFCRADQPAEKIDFVLIFRYHSNLLPKMFTVSTRPVLRNGLFLRLASEPAGEQTGQNICL